MVNTAAANTVEFTLPSELGAQRILEQRILQQIRKAGATSRDEFCVRLALEEAVTNAMVHGNALDPGKKVAVKSVVRMSAVTIVVEDEGAGFVPEDVPNPTEPENIGRPHGRGVMLIQAFMDDVEYNDKGNRVQMSRMLGQETGPVLRRDSSPDERSE